MILLATLEMNTWKFCNKFLHWKKGGVKLKIVLEDLKSQALTNDF
jgi:hypothetical protein